MNIFRKNSALFLLILLLLAVQLSHEAVNRRLPTEANWVNVVDSGFGFPKLTFSFSVDGDDLFQTFYLALFFPFNVGETLEAYVGEASSSCSQETNSEMSLTYFERDQVTQDNYFIYYMEMELEVQRDLVVTLQTTAWANEDGLYDPIQMHAVSKDTSYFISYDYEMSYEPLWVAPKVSNGLGLEVLFDTTEEIRTQYSHQYEVAFEITPSVSEAPSARIYIDLFNGFTFGEWEDESICISELNDDTGAASIPKGAFNCSLENDRSTMLVTMSNGLTDGKRFRLKAFVVNPNTETKSNIRIYTMKRYSPILLEYIVLKNTLKVEPIKWSEIRVYVGQGIEVTYPEGNIPNSIGLYKQFASSDKLVYNTIRFDFRIPAKLADISESTITLQYGPTDGTAYILRGYFYHNLPSLTGEELQYTFTEGKVAISRIGVLKTNQFYSIGLKVGFGASASLQIGSEFGILELSRGSDSVVELRGYDYRFHHNFFMKNADNRIWRDKDTIIAHTRTHDELVDDQSGKDFTNDFMNNYYEPRQTGLVKSEGRTIVFQFEDFLDPNDPLQWIDRAMVEIITTRSVVSYHPNFNYNLDPDTKCWVCNGCEFWQPNEPTPLAHCSFDELSIRNFDHTVNTTMMRYMALNEALYQPLSSSHPVFVAFTDVSVTGLQSFSVEDTDVGIFDAFIRMVRLVDEIWELCYDCTTYFKAYDNLLVFDERSSTDFAFRLDGYYHAGTSANSLTGNEVPVLLRFYGKILNDDRENLKSIGLFFEAIEPLTNFHDGPDVGDNIGCGTPADSNVKDIPVCHFFDGASNPNSLNQYFVEIEVESDEFGNVGLSDAGELYVAIPGSTSELLRHTSAKVSIGFFTKEENSLGVMHRKLVQFIIPDSVLVQTKTLAKSSMMFQTFSDGLNFMMYDKLTGPNNKPSIGETKDTIWHLNYKGDSELAIGGSGYIGAIQCMNYPFNSDASFSAGQLGTPPNSNRRYMCLENIAYEDVDGSGERKHCVYCPHFTSLSTSTETTIKSIAFPDYTRKFPLSAYGSVIRDDGALRLIQNQGALNHIFFMCLSMGDASISPNQWVNGQVGLKLEINFTLPYEEESGVWVTVKLESGSNWGVTFKNQIGFEEICMIESAEKEYSCEFYEFNANYLVFWAEDGLPMETVSLIFYGLDVVDSPPATNSFRVYVHNAMEALSDKTVKACSNTFDVIYIPEEDSSISVTASLDNKFSSTRSKLSIHVSFNNFRELYKSDLMIVNLGPYARAITSTSRVWCRITDESGQFLRNFASCDASNLNAIQIRTSKESNTEIFTIELVGYTTLFSNPTVDTNVSGITIKIKGISAKIAKETTPPYASLESLDSWQNSLSSQNLYWIRKISAPGFVSLIDIYYTPEVSALDGDSFIFLDFPFRYSKKLTKSQVYCMIGEGDYTNFPLKCKLDDDIERLLVISGFPETIEVGSETIIRISGIDVPPDAENSITYFYRGQSNLIESSAEIGTLIEEQASYYYGSSSSSNSILGLEDLLVEARGMSHYETRRESDISFVFETDENPISQFASFYISLSYLTNSEYVYFSKLNQGGGGRNSLYCTLSQISSSLQGTKQLKRGTCSVYGNIVYFETGVELESYSFFQIDIEGLWNPTDTLCSSMDTQLFIVYFDGEDTYQMVSVSPAWIYNIKDHPFVSNLEDYTYFELHHWNQGQISNPTQTLTVTRGVYNSITLKKALSTQFFNSNHLVTLLTNPFDMVSLYSGSELIKESSTEHEILFAIIPEASLTSFSFCLGIIEDSNSKSFTSLPLVRVEVENIELSFSSLPSVIELPKGEFSQWIALDLSNYEPYGTLTYSFEVVYSSGSSSNVQINRFNDQTTLSLYKKTLYFQVESSSTDSEGDELTLQIETIGEVDYSIYPASVTIPIQIVQASGNNKAPGVDCQFENVRENSVEIHIEADQNCNFFYAFMPVLQYYSGGEEFFDIDLAAEYAFEETDSSSSSLLRYGYLNLLEGGSNVVELDNLASASQYVLKIWAENGKSMISTQEIYIETEESSGSQEATLGFSLIFLGELREVTINSILCFFEDKFESPELRYPFF